MMHLHGKNIIHRDMKPNNILIHVPEANAGGQTEMITPIKPQIKLADFGISKLLETDKQDFTNTSVTDPRGSRGWMSPEWYQSRRCDYKVDIWAAGCLFLYILSGGKHPFGEDPEMRQTLIKQGRIELRPRDLKPPYFNDNGTYQFIKSMLDTDPNKRPDAPSILAYLKRAEMGRTQPFGPVEKVNSADFLFFPKTHFSTINEIFNRKHRELVNFVALLKDFGDLVEKKTYAGVILPMRVIVLYDHSTVDTV